jgi:protein SCO1/2
MSEGGSPPKRNIRWEWIAAAVVLLAILSVVAFVTFQPIKVLPRVGLAPGFILTDQNGQRLTNEDLRGKLVLYNFSYARCGEPCQGMDATMRAVQDRLAEQATGAPVELVTISFDPEHDTPAALLAHAGAVGADADRWRFAVGEPSQTKAIVGGGFEVYYEPDGAGGFKFAPAFTLVDGWGIIRAVHRNRTPDADLLVRQIRVIDEEVRKSRGVARVAYEAAHLFACYAQ